MFVWVAWDIDGTLLRADSGAALAALDLEGIARASGCPDPRPLAPTHGKTDLQILEEMVGPEYRDAALAAFRAHWPTVFDPSVYRALPGVHAALDHLPTMGGVGSSLVTGNLQERARVKVEAIDAGHHFTWEVSAFGDESTVRADLVRAAVTRSAGAAVIIVGDTVRDVEAARAGGAHAVAVATGPESVDELAAAGPDLVISDFAAEADAFFAFVDRIRSTG